MKLLTKSILDQFVKQGYTGDKTPNEITVIAKLFGGGACSWYLYEYNSEEKMFMAFVTLGDPEMAECGNVSQEELESVRFPPFGLGIERDKYFKPMKLSEVISTIKSGGHI